MLKYQKNKYWIAIYTKPRHEKVIRDNLISQGFEVYLPMLKKRRKWADRKTWVEFPLFKSYLFVKIKIKNSIFVIQNPGVVKIIKFGNKTAIIHDNIINALKLMIDGGYSPKTTDYFIKGDPVLVKEGPLKGIEGEIKEIEKNDRLIIHIDALQHSVSVKIDKKFLKSLKNKI